MKEAHPQPKRRSQARYAVDSEVSLVFVNQGGTLTARMFELSLDGCRVRAGRDSPPGAPGGVEVMFKVNGIAFRLAGTMQWVDARQTAGIRFSPMARRRREALEELLAELEAEEQAREAAKAQSANEAEGAAAAQEATPAAAAVLSLPNPVGIDPERSGTSPTPSATPDQEIQPPIPIFATCPKRDGSKPAIHPAQATGRERRAHVRHTVDTGANVSFIDVRAKISGRIRDVSMSGCRIRTGKPFPVGIYRRVETEFKLDGLSFRLAGVVQALHDRFTVGIRFLDMSPRKRGHLAQLIEEIEQFGAQEQQQQ